MGRVEKIINHDSGPVLSRGGAEFIGGEVMKSVMISILPFILLASQTFALETMPKTASTGADVAGEWYFPEWLGTAPYAPVFEVRDTENKYGRYAKQTKTITIKDLIKYHGHFCGGLVESAASLRIAFDLLFSDKIIDRTDLLIVSNNSACGGDVAAYLTGSRTRFGSHVIDNTLTESEFYVRQVSTNRTVHVKLNPAVYPKEVKTQMKRVESAKFDSKDIDLFQELQWAYAKRMVSKPLGESFLIEELNDYKWPEATCRDLGKRKDNDYKSVPVK
jgi:formylmethanofuran dehydrogenase subunit E